MENIKRGIDLSTLGQAVEEVLHDCPVQFDDEAEAVVGFKILDSNSEAFRAAKRSADVAAVKRASVKKQRIDGKTDEGANALLDLGQQTNRVIAIAIVKEWYGFTNEGKPAPLTEESLKKVLTRFPDWFDKIIAKAGEGAAFLASSSKA